ncbi:NADPH-dependent 1-acyldihydroxyacetone phosphate reductase [Madurella mycetomatis]|uniref:NADPH-dependent 1-acyldihydroxyacetone phosphate reductase n=1 Tax=Madurella mycetomatis TaxID=100816 RepID=A0A175W823_9PEZI|nr:NADPH-dependent 1-acyldihydroxyacetone phosphate reductase [Madurella mycetomatis]
MAPKPGQKAVLITGCTPGGIGHALALEFHAKGVHVIATARNPAVLKEMADMGMTALTLDVTNADSIKACHDEVSNITGGKLDILVNNAGRTHTHPATDIDMDDVRETFETNVFGVMAMCAAFSDLLIAARGLIVNIASLAAVTPYVFGSVYCATKGAVVSYSRTLRLELKPFGVRVMVAMTGTVRSQIASRTHRTLPPGSIYERVRGLFERRLTFSQNNATVETGDYARQLVAKALASEMPLLLRTWFGRPDWFWAGGMAWKAWFATCLGEWLFDIVLYRMIGMPTLERVLKEEERQKKLK